MEGLQLLTTVGTEFEAELIKQKLEEHGIASFIQSADSENMLVALDATEGVGIYIEPYDFEKASWLIHDAQDTLTEDMEVGGSE